MKPWLRILALAVLCPAPLTLAIASGCEPRIIESPTSFPMRSQLRGQAGIVYLDVTLDSSGQVARTDLVRSSGYRLLDRSARESVAHDWRFDVSTCVRKDLPATQRIAVEYRNEEYR